MVSDEFAHDPIRCAVKATRERATTNTFADKATTTRASVESKLMTDHDASPSDAAQAIDSAIEDGFLGAEVNGRSRSLHLFVPEDAQT